VPGVTAKRAALDSDFRYFLPPVGATRIVVVMTLEALVVSRDPETLRVLRSTLGKLDVTVEVCTGAEVASEILAAKKFDVIIIDCDDMHGGIAILQQVRKERSNKTSVTFAVLNGVTDVRTVFQMGAGFVLQKPITITNALRSFHAAYGLMHRERRRYFRLPVDIPVTLTSGRSQETKVTACNLSEGGMAIESSAGLPGDVARVQFVLPGTDIKLSPKAELAWSDASGRGGIRFLELTSNAREQLENWLLQKMEQREPGMPSVRA
jgi:DNA-binding response OmpR family regulator